MTEDHLLISYEERETRDHRVFDVDIFSHINAGAGNEDATIENRERRDVYEKTADATVGFHLIVSSPGLTSSFNERLSLIDLCGRGTEPTSAENISEVR